MMDQNDEEEIGAVGLFEEPSGYFKTQKPATQVEHVLPTGESLQLSLVGENPLWGHHLFLSAIYLSSYLYKNGSRLCHGKRVIEFGAGAGLPGLAAWRYGAKQVVITDYPDADLIENINANIARTLPVLSNGRNKDTESQNIGFSGQTDSGLNASLTGHGYVWGKELTLPTDQNLKFDTMILSDLVFNHSQHSALVSTVKKYLSKTSEARALVFFTPHRPHFLERDLAFFDVLEKEGEGLQVKKVVEHKMEKVMFPEDTGDVELRKTVFGWEVKWSQDSTQQ